MANGVVAECGQRSGLPEVIRSGRSEPSLTPRRIGLCGLFVAICCYPPVPRQRFFDQAADRTNLASSGITGARSRLSSTYVFAGGANGAGIVGNQDGTVGTQPVAQAVGHVDGTVKPVPPWYILANGIQRLRQWGRRSNGR